MGLEIEFNPEYSWGDVGNFAAQVDTLHAVRRQTATLQTELRRQQQINADLSRKTDTLIEMQQAQMEYQQQMDELRTQEEAAKKSLRQEMVTISSIMDKIGLTYES